MTVSGAGTVALEFADQIPQLDTMLMAVGGGMLAGALTALPDTHTAAVGVEPSTQPAALMSLLTPANL